MSFQYLAGAEIDYQESLEGIGALMARRPDTLSGGERQRVAIARALAVRPRLLLMDEPLAALDAERKAEVLPYLEQLHRELALPVVYVTHALDEVARLADHALMLREGRVQAVGPVVELLARPDLPLAPLDEAGVVIAAEVAEIDADYGLARIAFDGGSLWVGASGAASGERVRARVLARDVSVARVVPVQTSVINLLAVRLEAMHAERHTAMLVLAVDRAGEAGGVRLLARITRRSADALALRPGDALVAQVKGVALM